jgi:hypothetical protein
MKTINKYIGVVALATMALTSGCSDDFLQKDSLTSVSTSTFWQTETDALNGLAACYDGLQDGFLYNDGYMSKWDGCGPLNMDAMTDNGGRFNWSGWTPGYDICNGTHSSSSHLIEEFWKSNYEVIKRCNTLIENIDRVDMDASDIATYKAEAVVIRSLMYINLTMTYNDVPYLTAVQSLTDAEAPKTSRADIVAGVISDLKEAAAVLPTKAAARGRVTKGAALSILGRVALYNEKWDEAISAYQQVLNLGYSLFSDYSTLFTEANEACDEIVWAVRYEGPGKEEGSSLGGHWDTPLEAINGTIDMADAFYCLDGKPTTDKKVCEYYEDGSADLWILNTARYENRDPRLRATLFLPGMAWGDKDWYYGGAAASYSTLYVMKYFNPALNWSTSWDSGQDFYLVRYAEVLLSLAEAYVEKGTNLTDAIALVDQVRTRAGMPTVEAVEGSGVSQSDLRDIVRHERRVELAFEGFRLYDLYRWHLLKDAVDRINAEASYYNFWYEYRNYRGEQEYIWPIPQTELDCNSQLEQNELWK